ncbi:MAG: universal stress protein [Cyanobacteria bacterium J06636_16]
MSWLKRKSVLVPLDFSELAYEAIAPAKEYVEDIASLKLLHVLAPLHPADPAAMWGTVNEDERKQKVRDFLQSKLDEMGCGGAHMDVCIGDPTTKIIGYAKEINADLIVMSSHGRKDISRFFLGSVAEQVVRLSPCPVLVLK